MTAEDEITSKWWRLNNLYWIIDKDGKKVLFRCNRAQKQLFDSLWWLNIILKARQLGYTTFIDLYILDECLFNSNVEAGIIAHTREAAADIFRRKIEFPYDNLPSDIRNKRALLTDAKSKMEFSNGSVISVGTTFVSATLQYLHISELGKIAKKFPEKAREIVAGALETVGQGDTMIFIESTGEGKSGAYYDLCKTAQDLQVARAKLTRMDYKFRFSPWFDEPEYRLDEPVVETTQMQEYFAEVQAYWAKQGRPVRLTRQQRAWYIKKRANLGEDVKQQYPATPAEAFESGVEGCYFAKQFQWLREHGRITNVPHTGGVSVDTWWDLGMDGAMAIWFSQDIGREVHVIDFYECYGEGFAFYRDMLDKRSRELGYRYGRMVAPHDMKVRELGPGISRLESMAKIGVRMDVAPRPEVKIDAIQTTRRFMTICWFDAERTSQGTDFLENYRQQWDDINSVWKGTPLKNDAVHAADAFQTLATAHDFRPPGGGPPRAKARPVVVESARGWT